jgi:DNA (cytosine-5)-methyltransferase 1
MGLHEAGFDVVGVDIRPQPRYPFEFHQADALTYPLEGFDFVWASPPCQRFSTMTRRWGRSQNHPDLIDPIRQRFLASGVPWVMENVPGAPMRNTVPLCGSMFGLGVRRHRVFESSFAMPQLPCRHAEQGRAVGVYGHAGGRSRRDGISFAGTAQWKEAMGIDWMVGSELAEAIPPAYGKWIGEQVKGSSGAFRGTSS